jgi:hypothetical protein
MNEIYAILSETMCCIKKFAFNFDFEIRILSGMSIKNIKSGIFIEAIMIEKL